MSGSLTDNGVNYIQEWQRRREANIRLATPFGQLATGTRFVLPGGLTQQIKMNATHALAGSQFVCYRPWEQVVPVAVHPEAA